MSRTALAEQFCVIVAIYLCVDSSIQLNSGRNLPLYCLCPDLGYCPLAQTVMLVGSTLVERRNCPKFDPTDIAVWDLFSGQVVYSASMNCVARENGRDKSDVIMLFISRPGGYTRIKGGLVNRTILFVIQNKCYEKCIKCCESERVFHNSMRPGNGK